MSKSKANDYSRRNDLIKTINFFFLIVRDFFFLQLNKIAGVVSYNLKRMDVYIIIFCNSNILFIDKRSHN